MNDKVTYQINTALGTTEGLTGIGLEQIVDAVSGEVIARFWNGSLSCMSNSSLSHTDAAQGCVATVIISEAA